MTVLVTGAAGFIGFHLSKMLLANGVEVVGLDNLNNYYDPKLKAARLDYLYKLEKKSASNFIFIKEDISDQTKLNKIFEQYKPEKVVNLAAQAGVRYSIENPSAYINSNIVGFSNILECCRHNRVKHLVFASSSSVYGGNKSLPFSESAGVDHPVSLYAASKKCNELMAHSYSHLYGIPCTGLRFFTVYGPWGRPDMALFKFTKLMMEGKPIDVYNNGEMIRDFTYIDDVIESLVRVINKPPKANSNFNNMTPNPSKSWAPYLVFNIGNSNPTSLIDFIAALEKELGIEAIKNFLPMQAGDVSSTAADTSEIESHIAFKPDTSVITGVKKFVKWYKKYYS